MVDSVYVGPGLPVNFDGDKVFVEKFCRLRVVKRLFFHDVAPMAGRVSDADKDRNSAFPGGFECSIAPWIPVDGVVGVLLEVGAGLKEEPIGVNRRAVGIQVPGPGFVSGPLVGEGLGESFFGAQRKSWESQEETARRCRPETRGLRKSRRGRVSNSGPA